MLYVVSVIVVPQLLVGCYLLGIVASGKLERLRRMRWFGHVRTDRS